MSISLACDSTTVPSDPIVLHDSPEIRRNPPPCPRSARRQKATPGSRQTKESGRATRERAASAGRGECCTDPTFAVMVDGPHASRV